MYRNRLEDFVEDRKDLPLVHFLHAVRGSIARSRYAIAKFVARACRKAVIAKSRKLMAQSAVALLRPVKLNAAKFLSNWFSGSSETVRKVLALVSR
jgi:hypothetical protein